MPYLMIISKYLSFPAAFHLPNLFFQYIYTSTIFSFSQNPVMLTIFFWLNTALNSSQNTLSWFKGYQKSSL